MRAEAGLRGVELSASQERVATFDGSATVLVVGPPGCGKTTALAAHVCRLRQAGQSALVICSHPGSVTEFRRLLTALGASADIGLLCEHAAAWMRNAYIAAGVSPRLGLGNVSSTRDILAVAARGLLDMSWPMFAQRQFTLDLPHLGRPDAFLDEAASLFTLLQRARIGPDEFEQGCAAGLAAFYGEQVERAVALLQDPVVRERASQRGREACRAPAATLALQRAAERDVATVLTQLYREYLVAAAQADLRAPEDIVDAAIGWLGRDTGSAAAIAAQYASIVVDDAEDGEPGLVGLISLLKAAGNSSLIVAGWESARVDGFQGRRSGLALGENGTRVELAPFNIVGSTRYERLSNEEEEIAWLAGQICELVSAGIEPDTIALLCRSSQTAAHYARALRASGLAVAVPPNEWEDETALLDLLSLGAAVQDPFQSAHVLRVLSSPLLGLSDAAVWTLCRDPAANAQLALPVGEPPASSHAGAGGTTLARNVLFGTIDGLLSEEQRTRLVAFRAHFNRWRDAAKVLTPAQIVAHLAAAAGFNASWQAQAAYRRERLLEDERRLLEALTLMQGALDGSLAAAALRLQERALVLKPAARGTGAVVSDSIAGAKGQRWRHVFVAGVAHERFPRIYTSHAIAFSRTFGLIVRENVARGASQTAKYAWYYARFGAKGMYVDEERRALDYGLARATVSAVASGYGSPPRWARDQDLLAGFAQPEAEVPAT